MLSMVVTIMTPALMLVWMLPMVMMVVSSDDLREFCVLMYDRFTAAPVFFYFLQMLYMSTVGCISYRQVVIRSVHHET